MPLHFVRCFWRHDSFPVHGGKHRGKVCEEEGLPGTAQIPVPPPPPAWHFSLKPSQKPSLTTSTETSPLSCIPTAMDIVFIEDSFSALSLSCLEISLASKSHKLKGELPRIYGPSPSVPVKFSECILYDTPRSQTCDPRPSVPSTPTTLSPSSFWLAPVHPLRPLEAPHPTCVPMIFDPHC